MTLELAWFATRISQKHVIFLQSTGLNIKVLLDYIEMKGKMKIKIVHMISKFSYTILLFFSCVSQWRLFNAIYTIDITIDIFRE